VADSKLNVVITAQDKASAILRDVRGQLGGIEKAAGGLKGVLSGISPALVGAFSVAGIAAFTRSVVDGIDKLNDWADATGASIENLSALEDVAVRTGTSMDTAGDAVVKLNKALGDAKPGSGAEQAFKALGLQVAELKKLDPVEALQQVAKALAGFADDGNKARIVQELFGKSLKQVAPLLKDLAEAQKLQATLTRQQAEEAEKLNKEFFKLQKNATDLARELSGPVVRGLNRLIEGFRVAKQEGQLLNQLLLGPLAKVPTARTGGATGDFGEPESKPSLPDLPDPASVKKTGDGYKKASAERLKLREDAAKAIVDIEEQAAKDTAEAWKVWEDIQMRDSKARAEAFQKQWKQVFDEIDEEQERAIQEGKAYLDSLGKTGKTVGDELALVFSSAAGEAISNFKDLRSVLKGVLADIAQITIRQLVTKPLEKSLGAALDGVDILKGIGSLFGGSFASGIDYVPRDMLALIHRGERVVPAAQNNGAAGATIINNIDARADQAQVAQMVAAGVQQGLQAYARMQRAQGIA
jgi:gas vesicle protein